jgi:hypothetical protein
VNGKVIHGLPKSSFDYSLKSSHRAKNEPRKVNDRGGRGGWVTCGLRRKKAPPLSNESGGRRELIRANHRG